jgi:hypothetical protein
MVCKNQMVCRNQAVVETKMCKGHLDFWMVSIRMNPSTPGLLDNLWPE